MYRLYFKSETGQYHYGLLFEDFDDATRVALAYRRVVPQIMITNGEDHSVFEMEHEVLLHPEMQDVAHITSPEDEDLPSIEREYLALIRVQTNPLNGARNQKIERKLLAAAARDDLNLRDLGWSREGDEAIEDDPDLFPLLHNRISRENQLVPEFIGEFEGVEALPRRDYPAIYFWIDKQLGSVSLAFNDPLLERWCVEEARHVGFEMDVTDLAVEEAIAMLRHVTAPAFEESMQAMRTTALGSTPRPAERMPQTTTAISREKKPWWRMW